MYNCRVYLNSWYNEISLNKLFEFSQWDTVPTERENVYLEPVGGNLLSSFDKKKETKKKKKEEKREVGVY